MIKLTLSKNEADRLLKLLDVITDKSPQLRINEVTKVWDIETFWDIYLRLYQLVK